MNRKVLTKFDKYTLDVYPYKNTSRLNFVNPKMHSEFLNQFKKFYKLEFNV